MNKQEKTLTLFIQCLSEAIIEASRLMNSSTNTPEDIHKLERKIGESFALVSKLVENEVITQDRLIDYADKKLKSLTRWEEI